jgi:hypothetical protein
MATKTRARTTINTSVVRANNFAAVYVKLTPRAQRKRNQAALTQPMRSPVQERFERRAMT